MRCKPLVERLDSRTLRTNKDKTCFTERAIEFFEFSLSLSLSLSFSLCVLLFSTLHFWSTTMTTRKRSFTYREFQEFLSSCTLRGPFASGEILKRVWRLFAGHCHACGHVFRKKIEVTSPVCVFYSSFILSSYALFSPLSPKLIEISMEPGTMCFHFHCTYFHRLSPPSNFQIFPMIFRQRSYRHGDRHDEKIKYSTWISKDVESQRARCGGARE